MQQEASFPSLTIFPIQSQWPTPSWQSLRHTEKNPTVARDVLIIHLIFFTRTPGVQVRRTWTVLLFCPCKKGDELLLTHAHVQRRAASTPKTPPTVPSRTPVEARPRKLVHWDPERWYQTVLRMFWRSMRQRQGWQQQMLYNTGISRSSPKENHTSQNPKSWPRCYKNDIVLFTV